MSKKDTPTLFPKYKDAKKLFDLGFNTPSIVARPGVTSSVTPLFTIVLVSLGSSS